MITDCFLIPYKRTEIDKVMTDRQISKLEMYKATQQYLDSQAATWNAVPIVTQFKNELDTLLEQMAEHQEAKEASQVFLGENKVELKKNVAQKADILNDVLEAYASINEKTELEQKAAKTLTDLFRMRNEEFITALKELIALLEPELENLADYGVSAAQLDELKASFDRFLSLNGQPRQYRIASRQATQALEELFSTSIHCWTTDWTKC